MLSLLKSLAVCVSNSSSASKSIDFLIFVQKIGADLAMSLFFVFVPFIFRILVRYETFITRAQGPVIVIAKEEI